jgi:endonuclease YncB( thermonuclease family)
MTGLFEAARRSRFTDIVLFGLVVLALLGVVLLLPASKSLTPEGRASVIDGDSISVAGVEIRLQGIDAPEAEQTCSKGGRDWSCGRESSRRLARLVRGGTIRCQGDGEDQHGRLLARCKLGEIDINRWLVEQGWAVSFGGYHGAERQARQAKRGIWAGDFEQPSDWRADNRMF